MVSMSAKGDGPSSQENDFVAPNEGAMVSTPRILPSPDSNLALDLVRTTEAAALGAAAGLAGETRLPPTRRPWTRCGSYSTRSTWMASL